jgi:uncharacterized protein YoxC
MKRESTTSAVALLVAFVTLLFVYVSSGPTQTNVSASTPEYQKDVAELKKQISLLEERVNMLLEWHAQPRIHKETQF